MSHSTYQSLLESLRHNEPKAFRRILEKEGLPQDGNWYDYDLLVKALRMNRKRMVEYLLNKKCRVNKPACISANINTPLHMAAEKLGWCNIVEKMLKLKARVSAVNQQGNTALHLAFIHRVSDRVISVMLKHYLDETTVDVVNRDGLGFMHIACAKAKPEAIKLFFDVGMTDIYTQVSASSTSIWAGYSPLHFAVEAGKHEVVQFLCQYDADIYAQDRNKSTPIHLALERRDATMIDMLFKYDSMNENYVNDFGVSHFMAACAGSDSSVVEQYLYIAEQQRRPSSTSSVTGLMNGRVKGIPHYPNAGYTPLHFACEYGRINTVYGLLISGAGLQCLALNTENLTPYNLAEKQQYADICNLIEQFYIAHQDTVFAPVVQQQATETYYANCAQQVVHQQEYLCRSLQVLSV